jgi:2-C-methyl-D-erythritol 4-phosphate cytidylyltransferase
VAAALPRFPAQGEHLLQVGGATRAATVRNGLLALRQSAGAGPHDFVLVHDAARCLVTPTQIEALIAACEHDPVGGLLAHRLPDTLKVASPEGRVASTLTRADKWLAQTPQMFRIGMLLDALERAGDSVTDEASAIEAIGLAPLLVPGSAQNFKLTYPEDFALAEALLASRHGAKT